MPHNRIVAEDMQFITGMALPWERLAGKAVLITGANGFLPAYMVGALLFLNKNKGLGINIIGLVRNKAKAMQRFGHEVDSGQVMLIVQDVSMPLTVDGPVDYIVHAASQASPKYYGVDPAGTLKANVLGTYNLLEIAREKKTEGFLFFSSGEVYGELQSDNDKIKEDSYGIVDPMIVRSCYAESKRMGETMCVSWHHQFGVPAKVVRAFHTYGPGMDLDDGRVHADFVSDVLARRDIVMRSEGAFVRAFCYLSDATTGFFTVMLKGENGEAYNIGNDTCEISIRDLAAKIAGLYPELGMRVVQQVTERPEGYIESKFRRSCPNTDKARGLGWEPRFSIEDGFKRTIESYQI